MQKILALSLALGLAAAAQAAAPSISLERIYADPPLAGKLPRQATLSPGGQWLTYLRPSDADSEVMELWGQPLKGQGAPRKLVSAADLIGQGTVQLSEAEKMALERKRISGKGITGFGWCGKSDQQLIVPLSGDLYRVKLDGSAAQRLTQDPELPERDPLCNAAGTQIAYVKNGDLWVQPLDGAAKRLTERATATRSVGLAEFIAAEELSRHRGFWWSPDGSQILALEVDEAAVPTKTRAQIFPDRIAMTEQRYPAAGERNASVQAYAIALDGGAMRPLALPAEAEYIARAGWFADGTPWLQWFTRDQKQLTLSEFKPARRDILQERDAAWVEVHDALRELPALQLSGQPALLWSSERSGRRQLWVLDRVTGALKPLTQQPEAVEHVVCQAGERVVFAGVTERGRSQELFATNLQGHTQMLASGAKARWRDASGDTACERLLVTESAWGQPPRTSVQAVDGKSAPLPLVADAADPLLAQIIPQVRALDLLAADGRTRLNATYIAPMKATAGKHPVIVRAYGGPGSASVGWRWDGETALVAHWQRLGFGVMTVDTRGMQHRDRDFTRAHYRAFGEVEVADLFAAVRQLPQLVPSVDAARIGFTGWSYGGYLAARAMLDAHTPFAAAIAGAPPTDWTLYDTAYTERYLGMPEGGKAAPYASSNLLTRAALLQKPLMLIHGTADDNVLFEHSLRLITALQTEGKLFETVVYPGHAHGIRGNKARLHLSRTQTDFFVRHLKP